MINLYTPTITNIEKRAVNDALNSKKLSGSTQLITDFENKFSQKYKLKYCLSTNSGTSALHLALLSLGIGKGDEVIIPSLTFIATANAVNYVSAKPVIVDVERNTYQISIEEIEKNINKNTKAIIPVHLYGNSPDLRKINQIAKKYKLKIIQDSAEALGTTFENKPSGSYGDIGIYSFYPNKLITTGEGGLLTTSSKNLYRKAKKLRGQGLKENTDEYIHDVVGYNYRMTSLSAALGIAQLKNIDSFLSKKISIFNKYKKSLEPYGVSFIETIPEVKNSYWLTVADFKSLNIDIDKLRNYLLKKKIETKKIFFPIDRQVIYKSKKPNKNSMDIYNNALCLPSYPGLTDKQVSYIISQVISYFK